MKKKYSIAVIPDIGGGPWRYERCKPWYPANVLFNVVSIPGFGGVPANPELNSIEAYASYIHQKIQKLPPPRFIFATGTGASIALQIIQKTERQPSGLILHAPVWNRPIPQPFPELIQKSWLRPLLRKVTVSRIFREQIRKRLFRQPVPDTFIHHFFEEYSRCEVFDQMFRLINPEWFNDLREVSIPSQILWGGNEVKPSQQHINAVRQKLPEAEVKYIKEWDYFPMIEQPRSFAAQLTKTIREMAADTKKQFKNTKERAYSE